MKTITKEQIDQAILSATKKMIENMPNQYANAIEERMLIAILMLKIMPMQEKK